ncbi:MAG: hypothetical protein ACLFQX_00540 [Candidatus Kapaibacterium sp.]
MAVFLAACENSSQPKDNAKQKLRAELLAVPARNLDSFDFDPESPIAGRTAMPQFILDYMCDIDDAPEYQAYPPTGNDGRLLAEYLDLLPPGYLPILRERLLGIYFVDGLTYSGYTDFVVDPDSDSIYCFIVLNAETLDSEMQRWVGHKENTCFRDDCEDEIRIALSDAYKGLLYILIHEASHVIDYINGITPYTEPDIATLRGWQGRHSEFTEGVWADYGKTIPQYEFTYHSDITFYGFRGGPKISDSNASEVYEGLAQTPFTSLYGSINWAEDFAEYMTFYHLTRQLGISYRIEVIRNDSVIYEYEPFLSPLVAERINNLPDFY